MGSQSDDAILRAIVTVVGHGGCLTVVVALGLIIGLVATVWKVWHG